MQNASWAFVTLSLIISCVFGGITLEENEKLNLEASQIQNTFAFHCGGKTLYYHELYLLASTTCELEKSQSGCLPYLTCSWRVQKYSGPLFSPDLGASLLKARVSSDRNSGQPKTTDKTYLIIKLSQDQCKILGVIFKTGNEAYKKCQEANNDLFSSKDRDKSLEGSSDRDKSLEGSSDRDKSLEGSSDQLSQSLRVLPSQYSQSPRGSSNRLSQSSRVLPSQYSQSPRGSSNRLSPSSRVLPSQYSQSPRGSSDRLSQFSRVLPSQYSQPPRGSSNRLSPSSRVLPNQYSQPPRDSSKQLNRQTEINLDQFLLD